MNRLVTLLSSSLICLPALAQLAQAEIVVNISKSQQQLAVTIDGTELYRCPVSTGRGGLDTPSGIFRPIRLERQWYSSKYDGSPMPYSIFFHRGYAVHGTYEKRNLGRAVSHGCVRLLPSHAATLFSLVRVRGKDSTRIVVTDAPLPGAVAADHAEPRVEPKIEFKADPAPRPRTTHSRQPRIVQQPAVRPRFVERHSSGDFIARGDEAAVMRGRAAWLRSLDRQYGIAR